MELNTSVTKLEDLLACPKKYAYKIKIGENELLEKVPGQWLDAKGKGNVFHEIMKRYTTAKFIENDPKDCGETVDEDLLEKIVEEVKNDFLSGYPKTYSRVANLEMSEMLDVAKAHLKLQHEMIKVGWKPVLAEEKFFGAGFRIQTFSKNDVTIRFNGIIDRVDYKLDERKKTISFRIIDYKTGRKETKVNSNKDGSLIQHLMYESALMQRTGLVKENGQGKTMLDLAVERIAEKEGKRSEELANWEKRFEAFFYEFPYEDDKEKSLRIGGQLEQLRGQLEQLNCMSITRLKAVLEALENKDIPYPDVEELGKVVEELDRRRSVNDNKLSSLKGFLVKNDYKGPCEYCDYKKLCNSRG